MTLASFLTNPWTICISGGIASGLVVYMVTRFLFSRRVNREYNQKALAANREVLHGIRPSISEDQMPNQEVINFMIVATARRFGVAPSDMQSIEQYIDDLVMEVMESSFISCQTKIEFCQRLADLRMKPAEAPIELSQTLKQVSIYAAKQRRRVITMVSVMLAALASAVVGLVCSLVFGNFNDGVSTSSEFMTMLMPVAAMISLVATLPIIMKILPRFFASRSSRMPMKYGESNPEEQEGEG